MAVSLPSAGGKRELNSDINLVPFIDLLSVCICFLLIAAVWLQVGTVQVKQAFGTDAPDKQDQSFELGFAFVNETKVKASIKRKGKVHHSLEITAASRTELRELTQGFVAASLEKLRKDPAQQIPEIISAATITPHRDASYGAIMAVMDALRSQEIVNLAVVPKAS